jgi:hypothetical protein
VPGWRDRRVHLNGLAPGCDIRGDGTD